VVVVRPSGHEVAVRSRTTQVRERGVVIAEADEADETGSVLARVLGSRELWDSFNDGMVIVDLEGVVLEANARAAALLGVAREDLLGRTLLSHGWPMVDERGDSLAPDELVFQVALTTGQPVRDAIVGMDRGASERRWLKISASPLHLEGSVVGASVMFSDVTDSRALHRQLTASQDLLTFLSRHAADVVVIASHDARAEWVTDSVTDVFGWTPDEILGSTMDGFVHPDDLAIVTDYRRDAPDALTASFLVRLRCRDGTYRWTHITSRRFTDTATGVSKIVSSWHDAQTLMEIRQRLEQSQRRFRALAENASDVVCELDENFHVTWASPSVNDVLGWRESEVLGRSVLDFIAPDDHPLAVYEGANVAAGQHTPPLRIRSITSSGATRWVLGQIRSIPDDHHGAPTYIVTLRDIHDEELTRQSLHETEVRYRLLAENGTDLIILQRPDRVYQWVSPSATELVGWAPHEMIGKTAEDFVHPDDLDVVVRSRAHPVNGVFNVEPVRFRCADGTYVWVSTRGRIVYDDNGEVAARVVTLHDVSDLVTVQRSLAQSEERLRTIFDNQVDVTLALGLDTVISWITPSVRSLLGRTPDEVVGKSIADFLVPDDVEGLDVVVEQVVTGQPASYEARVRTLTGEQRWVAAHAQPFRGADGEVAGAVVSVRDVDEQHRLMDQLTTSESLFRLVMNSAPLGLALIDDGLRFVRVNPALCRILDREAPWLVEHRLVDVLGVDTPVLDQQIAAALASGADIVGPHEMWLRRTDGTDVWVEHSLGLLRSESGGAKMFVSAYVDITEAKLTREKLRFQATHDALTHLVNRRDLYVRAANLQEQVQRTGDAIGVLYLDVDDFKDINETWGHHVGDAVLVAVAERMSAVGRADDVVSRIGGDEFVLLLPGLHSVNDAVDVARKIAHSFEQPLLIDGESIAVSLSVGVALVEPGTTSDEALRRADRAMFEAKKLGRGAVATWPLAPTDAEH